LRFGCVSCNLPTIFFYCSVTHCGSGFCLRILSKWDNFWTTETACLTISCLPNYVTEFLCRGYDLVDRQSSIWRKNIFLPPHPYGFGLKSSGAMHFYYYLCVSVWIQMLGLDLFAICFAPKFLFQLNWAPNNGLWIQILGLVGLPLVCSQFLVLVKLSSHGSDSGLW
jgi:hypothetical protein